MTLTRRQLVLLVALTLLWGCNWPMMKFSLREVPPLTFRALTMSGGVLLMAGWFALRGTRLALPRTQIVRVFALAAPNIIGWHWASIIGLTQLAAGRAGILAFTMPVWTVLLGALLFGQRLTRRGEDGPEVISTRMANARVEVAQARHFDFVIINALFEMALFDLKTVVHSQRLKYAAQRRNKSQVFAALDLI